MALNKTQQELSSNIYVSQNTISEYENRKKEIKLSRLEDIAKELNGAVRFIPNEATTTIYLHQVVVIAKDTKTKTILQSESFNEAFEKFKTEIYYSYLYTDTIGNGFYEDNIIVNEKTIDDGLFIDGKTLSMDSLAIKLNTIKINEDTISNEDVKCSLFDLNEDCSTKIDLIIAEKTYDFIKEFINENSSEFFDTIMAYDKYCEEQEDLFIIHKVVPLYDKVAENCDFEKFNYFVR